MHSEIKFSEIEVCVLIVIMLFGAYVVVSLNDENLKLREKLSEFSSGDLWCEIKQNSSTTWKQCELVGKDELNRQVARVSY